MAKPLYKKYSIWGSKHDRITFVHRNNFYAPYDIYKISIRFYCFPAPIKGFRTFSNEQLAV